MKKYVSLVLAGVLTTGLMAGCGSTNHSTTTAGTSAQPKEQKKVLTMGTSADYPPFEYVNTAKSSDIIGFDVDIAKELGNKVGYEIKITDMDFNGLITALQAGKVDFVMAGMDPTPERQQNADFTSVYYQSDNVMLVKQTSGIKSVDDLKGKLLGVQVGSIQQDKAEELKKNIDFNITNRDRLGDLIQEVKSDRIAGVLMENVVAKGLLASNKDLVSVSIPNKSSAGASIAFPKNSELTKKFDGALQELKQSGELDKLIVKWFGDKQ